MSKEEDYGDYVTRCVCGFKHDDGYMIQCDDCSVWQHVACMQVDRKNLPDKYLCELCQPRAVDKRKARLYQLKKREDLSDLDDTERNAARLAANRSSSQSSQGSKKKKKGKTPEAPRSDVKRPKRDKPPDGSKKIKRKSLTKPSQPASAQAQPPRASSIQSLLTAASILDQDIWSANTSPWADRYEVADHNRYADPVMVLLSEELPQLKSEAAVYSQEQYCTAEASLPHPQCSVSEVRRRRKGVVAAVTIGTEKIVTEYKGKITTKQDVQGEVAPNSKSLWKHRPCPFVYLYDNLANHDLSIDARIYGNIARFIRRSCTPSCELRHFFVCNDLHFGVFALQDISPGEEITLPFDFRYDKCDYAVECACGQKASCLVARSNHVILSRKQGAKALEEESRSRSSSRQRSQLTHDEDSNSSWASTGSRRRLHHPPSLSPPLRQTTKHRPSISPPLQQSSAQASREVSSDSEDETESEGKRRKSREERKTEAVWRMFEKMEASAQRKRQQLCSEGSMDSDTLSSPSALHPPPLFSHKQGKERRTSSSSKKAQLLPGGRVRLSSVSSNDALSPAEFLEAFSPPITPDLSRMLLCPSPLHSPPALISPPSTPLAKFEISPYLHPLYLFAADFALPRKKAILQRWTAETCTKPPQPLWASRCGRRDYRCLQSADVDQSKGCLKHRWLKRHLEQQVSQKREASVSVATMGSDKENEMAARESREGRPLSHKKSMLERWRAERPENFAPSVTPMPVDTTQPEPRPLADAHPQGRTETAPEREVKTARVGNTSALFEDFSDDDEEFESPAQESASAFILPSGVGALMGGEGEEEEEEGRRREGPRTPPLEEERGGQAATVSLRDDEDSNLSSISDTSLRSDSDETARPITPPLPSSHHSSPLAPPPSSVPPPSMNVSDISSELDSSHGDGTGSKTSVSALDSPSSSWLESSQTTASPKGDTTISSASLPTLSSPVPAGITGSASHIVEPPSSVGSQSDDEAIQEVEMEPASPLPGGRVPEGASPGGLQEGRELGEPGGKPSLYPVAPVTVPGAEATSPYGGFGLDGSAKVPNKRKKINLKEYRNRARKPADQRKMSADNSSPPHTSTTPSFLSHTASSALLSSPSVLAATYAADSLSSAGKPSSGVGGANMPQFEPVSPDDDRETPPLVSAEQPGLALDGSAPPPAVVSRLAPAIAGFPAQSFVRPGEQGLAYIQQQLPPHSMAQYVVESRWNVPTMELAQDPRRGMLPGSEMYPQGIHLIAHPHPLTSSHPHQQDMMQPGPGGTGLLPLPPHPTPLPPSPHAHPLIMVQPSDPQQGVIQPGEFHPRQPAPPQPHAYAPHRQPRGTFCPPGPRPPGPSGRFY